MIDFKTITGTQILSLNTSPIEVTQGAVGYLPVAWFCAYKFNTGAFGTNLTIELMCGSVVIGEAANAISGTASKVTNGSITGGSVILTDHTPLKVRVKTGNPGAGNANASLTVMVAYIPANYLIGWYL